MFKEEEVTEPQLLSLIQNYNADSPWLMSTIGTRISIATYSGLLIEPQLMLQHFSSTVKCPKLLGMSLQFLRKLCSY